VGRKVRWLAAALVLAGGVALVRRLRGTYAAGERPGLRYAIGRVRSILSPQVGITSPTAGGRFERDVGVAVRDGTTLRVNVFRPEREGRYPVILCAHPYGKDRLPGRGLSGSSTRYATKKSGLFSRRAGPTCTCARMDASPTHWRPGARLWAST
jgi:hypothetical protein